MRFFDRLQETVIRNGSLLCVGLDPRPERFPAEILRQEDPILAFNRQIVDATRDLACAYKPNYAFYEAHGPEGLQALRRTIAYIGAEVPVILDAKRGDIGSTAAAYARAAFEVWGAGAVTVHPYLGSDSVAPFAAYAERGVFVLCHTSNPGASELQMLACAGEPLYQRVARLAQGWGQAGNVGLVVGATYPEALRAIRNLAPQAWLLVPGIGVQGGDLEAAVAAGLRAPEDGGLEQGGLHASEDGGLEQGGLRAPEDGGLEQGGLLINVSRAVYDAPDPRAAALAFRDRINAARQGISVRCASARKTTPPLRPTPYSLLPTSYSLLPAFPKQPETVERATEALILDLARIGAVRFGTFTLKSGQTSPIYIDLRLLASHPQVLGRVAAAYASLLRGEGGRPAIAFDRMAAIPYAALPIGTAVALQTGWPLIYPRKEVKAYGTRQAVEGTFQAGERAVVLDDLITTGESKIEAIAPLVQAGLVVHDVVVLIDRQSGGREALASQGYRLHAVLTLRQILDVLAAHRQVSEEQREQVLAWASHAGLAS